MRFISTGGKAPSVSLEDAVFSGPAPDGGLYVPERIDPVSVSTGPAHSVADTATVVARQLFSEDLSAESIERMVRESLDFEIPLVEVEPELMCLELFHGPTHAFKDVGARFMARLMAHFLSSRSEGATVLVATSGDTGSAVAHAFVGLEGFRVVVLFPRGKVSPLQQRLFTTLGDNVTAVSIDGTFDDCQRLVKAAFADTALRETESLVSANSINVARLLPQTFYYFHLRAQLPDEAAPLTVCTPSGNFGNVTAGLMAKRMGCNISRFVAATNVNDVVPEFLASGVFRPRASVPTLSNAMDVGDPSNFVRIQWLYNGDRDEISRDLEGRAFTDEQTEDAIRSVFRRTGYVLDPHGAVGYLGAKTVERGPRVFLGTAHPAKFRETVERVIEQEIPLPPALALSQSKPERVIELPALYEELKVLLEGS